MNVTRTGVIGDLHIPFHNPRIVTLVLDVFEDIGVDRIVLNGDVLDFYGVNSHGPKHPDIRENLEDELDAGREFFNNLRKRFPKIPIVFNAGNHEFRLDRFIIKNCKPFWNILTVEKQMNLELLDIEYFPYNNRYRLEKSNMYIQHSPASYSSPQANFTTNPDSSSIFNCSHRAGMAARTGSKEVYYSYFNGWLSTWDLTPTHKEAFRFIKNHNKWQNCFSIVTCIDETKAINNQYIIDDYKCVVDGNLYEAS